MIPTIALLAEPLSQGSPGLLPLLIAGAEPAQPALSIALPEDVNSIIPSHLGYGMSEWPRLHGGESGSRRTAYPAGAIKAGRGKPLTDAELFFPISPEAGPLDTGYRPAVTWFVHCHGDDDRLIETLESASLQCGAIEDRLSLVGRPTARVLACAACGFGDRVDCYRDLDSAIRALDTMLCGFIAADVILHDNRCASFLAALLELDQVASASCVLIAVEARGTAWHATVGDGGELTGRNGELLGRQAGVRVAAELWRSVYPVAGRSQNLWLAKSAGLIAQTSDEGEPAGLHLCSAVVTASLMETPGRAAVRAVRPGMVRDQATHAAVLFG
jgi:hypothetical protein